MKSLVWGLLFSIFNIATAQAQWHYARCFDDFMQGRWVQMDTVFLKQHGKGHKQGESDSFTLTTGDKNTDKLMAKEAFAVAKGDTVFLNCRKLCYDNVKFGKGYVLARRIGHKSLLFANGLIDKEDVNSTVLTFGIVFGAIGGALAAASLRPRKDNKQQVCYLISQGEDRKGMVNVRILNDALIEQMLEGHSQLLYEYTTAPEETERMEASRVVPLLEKAGLFEQWKEAQ